MKFYKVAKLFQHQESMGKFQMRKKETDDVDTLLPVQNASTPPSRRNKSNAIVKQISSFMRKNEALQHDDDDDHIDEKKELLSTPNTAPLSPIDDDSSSNLDSLVDDNLSANLDVAVLPGTTQAPSTAFLTISDGSKTLLKQDVISKSDDSNCDSKDNDGFVNVMHIGNGDQDEEEDSCDITTISNLTEAESANYSPGVEEFYQKKKPNQNAGTYAAIAERVFVIMDEACNIQQNNAIKLTKRDLTEAMEAAAQQTGFSLEAAAQQTGFSLEGLGIPTKSGGEGESLHTTDVEQTEQEESNDDDDDDPTAESNNNIDNDMHFDNVNMNEEIELVVTGYKKKKIEGDKNLIIQQRTKEIKDIYPKNEVKHKRSWKTVKRFLSKQINNKQEQRYSNNDVSLSDHSEDARKDAAFQNDSGTKEDELKMIINGNVRKKLDIIKEESESNFEEEEDQDSLNESKSHQQKQQQKDKFTNIKKIKKNFKRVPKLVKKRISSFQRNDNIGNVSDRSSGNISDIKVGVARVPGLKSGRDQYIENDALLGEEVVAEENNSALHCSSGRDILTDLSSFSEENKATILRLRSAPTTTLFRSPTVTSTSSGESGSFGGYEMMINNSISSDESNENKVKMTAKVWKAAVDPNTNRTYYYHRVTRETTWNKPADFDILQQKYPPSVYSGSDEKKKQEMEKEKGLQLNHENIAEDDSNKKKESNSIMEEMTAKTTKRENYAFMEKNGNDDDDQKMETDEKNNDQSTNVDFTVLDETTQQIQGLVLKSTFGTTNEIDNTERKLSYIAKLNNDNNNSLHNSIVWASVRSSNESENNDRKGNSKNLRLVEESKPFDEPMSLSPSRNESKLKSADTRAEEKYSILDKSFSSHENYLTASSHQLKKSASVPLKGVRTGISTCTKMSEFTESTKIINNTTTSRGSDLVSAMDLIGVSPSQSVLQEEEVLPTLVNDSNYLLNTSAITENTSADDEDILTTILKKGLAVPRERDLKVEDFSNGRIAKEIYNRDSNVTSTQNKLALRIAGIAATDSLSDDGAGNNLYIEKQLSSVCETEGYSYFGDYDDNTNSKLDVDSLSAISSFDENEFSYQQHLQNHQNSEYDAKKDYNSYGVENSNSIKQENKSCGNNTNEKNVDDIFSSSAVSMIQKVKESLYSATTVSTSEWTTQNEIEKFASENDWNTVSQYISQLGESSGNFLGMKQFPSNIPDSQIDATGHDLLLNTEKDDYNYLNGSLKNHEPPLQTCKQKEKESHHEEGTPTQNMKSGIDSPFCKSGEGGSYDSIDNQPHLLAKEPRKEFEC